MLLTLWNYIKGYVIIEISGFSIERFLNLTLHKGINIGNIKETRNGIVCKVLLNDFKKLKSCSKKSNCKIKIKNRIGLPFILFKNRKRKAFFAGILIFILFLWFLSSFIWSINIIGNENIDNNAILKFCEDNGFFVGAFKHNLKLKELETSVKNNFNNISWVTIQVKGTNATIKISEAIPNNITESLTQPSNIIAKSSGIITEIVTRNGTPLVKEKDVVKAGDILVSGELLIKDGEEIKSKKLVPSDADIKAKSWHTFKVSVPFKYQVKEYTKKTKTTFKFIFFNKEFNLNLFNSTIPFENYDIITSTNQLKIGNNFTLPFFIIKNKYREYNLVEKTYSLKEAELVANKLITEKIIENFDFSTDILDKSVSIQQLEDKLIATANLTIIQDITETQLISAETLERISENGTKENTN